MINKYPVPEHEQARLKALLRYDILDTPPDEHLDAITKIASYICNAPIALITFIENDRQWVKSRIGLEVEQTTREVSFCQHTIMGNTLFEINDTIEDERTSDNPYVLEDPNLRYYAGMPLLSSDGYSIGSLCVLDKVPRVLTDEQKEMLETLSREVMIHLELRKTNAVLQNELNVLVKEKIQSIEADLSTYRFALDQYTSLCISNITGNIESVNENFCKMTGYSEKELLGQFTGIAFGGQADLNLRESVRSVIEKGSVWSGEVSCVRKNGEQYWADVKVIPYLDEQKKPYRILLILQDITEKKNAADALQKLAALQQGILNGTDYAIVYCSPDGIIQAFNSGAEKMLGYKAEEMIGIHTLGKLHDPVEVMERNKALREELGIDVEPGFQTFVARANAGIADTSESIYIRKDGTRITVLLSISTLRNEKGEIIGHLGIARDISDSIQSREQIKLYEEVVRNMYAGLHVWELEEAGENKDLRLLINNEAAIKLGINQQDNVGRTMKELLNGIQSPIEEMYIKVIETGEQLIIPEFQSTLDKSRFFSISAFPLRNKRVGVLFMDITAMKVIQEELRKAKTLAEESVLAKDQFLANMSHEIRTPMNAIVGFTDLLLQTKLENEQKEYLDSVKLAGENLLGIINDILDFSKIESGKLDIESRPFRFKKMINHVHSLLGIKAADKVLDFNLHIADNIPEVLKGDELRLQQVLINLAGNAIKFTEKGSVSLSADMVKHENGKCHIRFSVKDTGIGISKEMQETVFERFTQANNEIHRTYGGTGLGLSISRNLIQLMGGRLELNSALGKGSEFYFELSFDTIKDNEIEKLEKTLNFNLPLSKVKVLLFEDNTLNQRLAIKVLSNFGFDTTLAENGRIGVDILKKESFDLILMDLQMPEIDGYQATEIIRNELKINTPIIAMTAHSLVGEREKCIAVGMNDFISKPFKQEDLYGKLSDLLPDAFLEGRNDAATNGAAVSVDLSYLREISGKDRAFEKNMLQVFLEEVPHDINLLQKAFDEHDTDLIWKTAHKLKSSMSIGGQNELIPLLNAIEGEARHTGLTAVSTDNFSKIKSSLESVYPVIRSIMEKEYS